MRVLLLFCHPVETSFHAALHQTAKEALERSGHVVDDLDLYREGFDPVLTREERLGYHDTETNRAPVQPYVDRLLATEALVFCFPVWNFGPPAMLKGFLDRVFLPGVAFELSESSELVPAMQHIRKIAAITTYGRPRWVAWYMGDPPRRLITRQFRRLIQPGAKVDYMGFYAIDASSEQKRKAFLDRVAERMASF
ncbi:MAG: NAD(P)H-dependent oxidoreductase [Pseudomonadota bacterium]